MKFFTSWCSHCHDLTPKFEQLAGMMHDVDFGSIQCDLDYTLCNREGIRGYPTLRLWKDGKFVGYEGSRDAHDMAAWIRSMF